MGRYKAGRPVLRILFVGDTDQDTARDKVQKQDNFEQSPFRILKEMLTGGITIPWNLLFSIVIGTWLMLTRITLGSFGSLANAEHFIGAMVITVTITAFAEVMRPIRFINILFAVSLLIVSFVYEASTVSLLSNIAIAIALFLLSIPRGKIKNSYGLWDKLIF